MVLMVFPCITESLASLDHGLYHSIAFSLHLDLANISGKPTCNVIFLELTFLSLVTFKFLLNDHAGGPVEYTETLI